MAPNNLQTNRQTADGHLAAITSALARLEIPFRKRGVATNIWFKKYNVL